MGVDIEQWLVTGLVETMAMISVADIDAGTAPTLPLLDAAPAAPPAPPGPGGPAAGGADAGTDAGTAAGAGAPHDIVGAILGDEAEALELAGVLSPEGVAEFMALMRDEGNGPDDEAAPGDEAAPEVAEAEADDDVDPVDAADAAAAEQMLAEPPADPAPAASSGGQSLVATLARLQLREGGVRFPRLVLDTSGEGRPSCSSAPPPAAQCSPLSRLKPRAFGFRSVGRRTPP